MSDSPTLVELNRELHILASTPEGRRLLETLAELSVRVREVQTVYRLSPITQAAMLLTRAVGRAPLSDGKRLVEIVGRHPAARPIG